MKKFLLFLLVLSSACLYSCGWLSQNIIPHNTETEKVTEGVQDEKETTAETEESVEQPAVGFTRDEPVPIGESVTIPTSKANMKMKVLEVLGNTEETVVKLNLSVANLKSGARLSLYSADFELLCSNGQIIEEEYAYEEYGIERKYDLNIPYVYNVTMGGDGSVDFYVYFHENRENAKILTSASAWNKYIYFSLT